MKDKIAQCGYETYWDDVDWQSLDDANKALWLSVANAMLESIHEEIEKVENPYSSDGSGFNLNTHRADGYDEACQKILSLLETQKG